MTPEPDTATSTPPPLIASQLEFQSALLWGVRTAVARSARRMWWVDSDFATWPLEDPELLDSLSTWLRQPLRRLVFLASDFEQIPRCHPRFMRWRADWAHAIDAWAPPDELAAQLPRLLLDDGPVCVHLIDATQWRGRATLDPRVARGWRDEVDAVLQRSTATFPVGTLGL